MLRLAQTAAAAAALVYRGLQFHRGLHHVGHDEHGSERRPYQFSYVAARFLGGMSQRWGGLHPVDIPDPVNQRKFDRRGRDRDTGV